MYKDNCHAGVRLRERAPAPCNPPKDKWLVNGHVALNHLQQDEPSTAAKKLLSGLLENLEAIFE